MKVFKIDDAKIYSDLPDFDEGAARRYLDYVNKNADFNHEEFAVVEVYVEDCQDGTVRVEYLMKAKKKFERIRRITG